MTEDSLFHFWNFKETVVVIDASQEDYYKGLCFIYGTRPKAFHVIQNGHAVRFEPTKEQRLFAYQYDPVSLQLTYTPYTPEQRVGSSVAADAKP